MEEKEDINALDEINKGACMGIDAIGFIIEKVSNQKLKKILEKQSSMYKEINEEIESIYPKYNEECPHETTAINKMMTSGTINMKLINNQSNSKLAELLIEGTNKAREAAKETMKKVKKAMKLNYFDEENN